MAGLPGTGKSAIASRLEPVLGAVLLDKDKIRAALFPPTDVEYSTVQDDFCVHVMMEVAEYILRRDPARHIILDGRTFSRQYQLAEWQALAARLEVPLCVVECVCADETVRERLARDAALECHPARNRDYAMYADVKARFEPIPEPKLVLNTDGDLASCVERALAYVTTGK